MTYIEFFDKDAVENICASLAHAPERVVLVGDRMKLLKKHAQRYREVFLARGQEIDFVCRSINKNNLQNIIDELSKLVELYGDCVFDLTGGEELYLVAVGMIAQRYPDKQIQMHRFNIRNGSIADCDQDGKTILKDVQPQMTVEENIRVYGGDILYDTVKPYGTHRWDMNEEFKADIGAMWDICKQNVRLWNRQIGTLAAVSGLADVAGDALRMTVPASALAETLARQGFKPVFIRGMMESLCEKNLITSYDGDGETLTIAFKNQQVKWCLTKAGQVLEMLIYLAALDARDNAGAPVYQDVMSGVCIDWDGEIHTEAGIYDTENEVDVLLMHGMIPVFVSCKNGGVEIDELYKLSTVAQRLGGKYAKKVLVATALDSATNFDEYFRQRAQDMGIRLVEGVQDMSAQELNRTVRSFWSN